MSDDFDIPFPYEPYPQQKSLIRALYEAIDKSRSGCFESPTGTGKSLSVICAALYWQQQEENRIIDKYQIAIEDAANSTSAGAPSDDWLAEIIQGDSKSSNNKDSKKKKGELDRHNDIKARIAKSLNSDDTTYAGSYTVFGGPSIKDKANKQDSSKSQTQTESADDDEFVLPMYDSDDASRKKSRNKKGDLLNDSGDDDDDLDDEKEEETDLPLPKIFYCSRTHTQIAQFVSEIRRTAYAGARVVTLGSRKNMCIHPTVSRLSSDVRMSDQCLEMQKSGKKTTTTTVSGQAEEKKQKVSRSAACEFHSRRLEERFSLKALGKLRDIEELVGLGKELKACPYYSTRRAVRYAQVVCMPYNVLLHSDLRSSMGIDVRGAVVIFDEAHNLVDAVNHTHSAEMALLQLDIAANAIGAYLERFQLQLGGRNVYYINLLASVVRKLRQVLLGPEIKKTMVDGSGLESRNADNDAAQVPQTVLLASNDFIFKARLDNINLFKLRRHMMETNLVARIGGYSESRARRAARSLAKPGIVGCGGGGCSANVGQHSVIPVASSIDADDNFNASTHALRLLLSLLACLTNNDSDGRVAILRPSAAAPGSSATPSIRFILLNPSIPFSQLVRDARNVVLLGGTLRPFSLVTSSLFAGKTASELTFFSCGHVVDRSAIVALAVSSGPRGNALEFTHSQRQSKQTLDELHGVLLSAARIVPNGFVCFFTSYAYMDAVMSTWHHSGQLGQLNSVKPVMCESRSAADSDALWNSFCTAAALPKGAMLMCVMGGKLSEGINFSDHLARCVAVIGMPYPDLRDPILQEKLKHSDSIEANSGKQLYEAMCMKSVNQSIGRSIRHIKDYATILLIDRRYSQPRVIAQLPSWIERSVTVANSWAEATGALNTFFTAKKHSS